MGSGEWLSVAFRFGFERFDSTSIVKIGRLDGVVDCGAFRYGVTFAIFIPWIKPLSSTPFGRRVPLCSFARGGKQETKNFCGFDQVVTKISAMDQGKGQSIQSLGSGRHPTAWHGSNYNHRHEGTISKTLPHTIQDNTHHPRHTLFKIEHP